MQPEEVSSSEAHRSTARMAGSEEERSVSALEEAFQRIKEAMGVTSIHVCYTYVCTVGAMMVVTTTSSMRNVTHETSTHMLTFDTVWESTFHLP